MSTRWVLLIVLLVRWSLYSVWKDAAYMEEELNELMRQRRKKL